MKVCYRLSIENRNQQYIQFELSLPVTDEVTEVKIPTWRPGRYELGYFAKNVRLFQATDENNQNLNSEKISHSVWKVDTKGINNIKVKYQFFAAELTGGSTFLDEVQLYVNPVNCFMYTEESSSFPIEVKLDLPKGYQIACSLNQSK